LKTFEKGGISSNDEYVKEANFRARLKRKKKTRGKKKV